MFFTVITRHSNGESVVNGVVNLKSSVDYGCELLRIHRSLWGGFDWTWQHCCWEECCGYVKENDGDDQNNNYKDMKQIIINAQFTWNWLFYNNRQNCELKRDEGMGKNDMHEKFAEVTVTWVVWAPENELFLTNFITDPIQRPRRWVL